MKKQELSWKAGGQQGEGLESLGEIFAAALCSLGYDVYGYRQFSSRIKGGHTSYKLRIANHPVATIASSCNLLIAMDPDTLEVDAPELTAEGILVTDAAWLEGKKPKVRTVALSWNELSKADGTTLPKNILALGITAALLGIDTAKLLPLLEKQYGRKGAEVMETNRLALETGYEYIKNNYHDLLAAFTMPELENPQPKLFMLGNEAVALGALTSGAKFMSAYPITPSSEIMEYMVKYAPAEGGVMLQTEDEISACTMAIGAAHAGARAFTATAGPGLSLMAEAIGLAEMTETPLVVIDTQRGGPSTGLPTANCRCGAASWSRTDCRKSNRRSILNAMIWKQKAAFPCESCPARQTASASAPVWSMMRSAGLPKTGPCVQHSPINACARSAALLIHLKARFMRTLPIRKAIC